MLYTMDYAHDPIFARDFLIESIGKCFTDEEVLLMLDDVTKTNLEMMDNEQANHRLNHSPSFREVWNKALENGMKPDEDGLYIYNSDNKTLADMFSAIEYVSLVGCDTAFAKYAIENKKVMDVIRQHLTDKEVQEIVTLIGYLK